MAYNYAREKRKFDAEWKRKALWYRKEGMSEEDIEAIHGFDLAQLLTLILIEGKTHKEAADILSCSRQYITKQLAQIRKIFKKE